MIRRDGDDVVIALGPLFRTRFPRSAIASIEDIGTTGWLAGIGAHGWGGHWTFNTRRSPAVRVTFASRQRGRVLGIPVGIDVLDVAPATAGELA